MPNRQVIRRVERPTIADFDDQWWPINVMLAMLSGVVGAVIIATSDFHTQDIYKSGVIRLGVLAAIVVGMSLSSLLLRGRLQRRMQFAVLFSLVLHLWLCLGSYYTYLGMAERNEANLAHADLERAEERERLIRQPEHSWQNSEHADSADLLEQPVATDTPDAIQQQVERSQTAAAQADKPSVDEPAADRPQMPSPAELERAQISAPRRSEDLSGPQISRREADQQRLEQSPAEVPEVQQQAEQQRKSDAAPTPLARQADAAPIERRADVNEPVAQSPPKLEPQSTELERRVTEALPDRAPAEPRVAALDRQRRSLADAEPAERPLIAVPRAAATAEEATPPAVAAPATEMARRDAGSTAAIQQAARERATADANPGEQSPTPAPKEIASRIAPRRISNDRQITSTGQTARAAIARAETLDSEQTAGQQIDASADAVGPAPTTAAGAARDLAPVATAQARGQQQAPDARFAGATSPSGSAPAPTRQLASATAGQPRRIDRSTGTQAPEGTAIRLSRSATSTAGGAAGGVSGSDGDRGDAGGVGTIELPKVASGGSSDRSTGGGGRGAFDPQPATAAGGAGRRASSGLPGGAIARASASAGSTLDEGTPGETGRGSTGAAASGLSVSGRGGAALGPATPLASRIGAPRRIDSLATRDGASSGNGAATGGGSGAQQPLARSSTGAGNGLTGIEPAEVPLPGVEGPQPFAPSGSAAGQSTAGGAARGELQPSVGVSGAGRTASSATGQLASAGSPRRPSTGGLPVRISAPEGPGGLSRQPTADLGLPTRRARPESDVVHAVASRMILEKSGGQPTIDARVRDTAVPGFKQRDAQDRQDVAARRGGSQGTERAVELGLDFLARHQSPDGSWSLHNFAAGRRGYEQAGPGSMQSDSAGTGLALLAFLGAGYTHTDGKYRLVVSRGLDFLIRNQKPDGDLFSGGSQYCWLYSHGIASIALCEAYGMTRDQVVEGPAQRAIDFIAAAQHPDEGGWRYSPGQDSDTSVSGWQLMALKSGELAGLKISPECYPRIAHWLDGAASSNNPSRYVYRPKATQQHQRETSLAMTAESLLMRQYLGWKRDNANLVAGADFLRANLPQLGSRTAPRRDAYYWYYATQVMFQMQGDHWKDWNDALRTLLVGSQLQAGPLSGSWDPGGPTADRWGAAGGRIYVTAMHLLMLEVYYRHLPLYQTLE